MKKGMVRPKVIAGVLTIFIIVMLMVAGPVQAFIIGLTISDANIIVGDTTSFTASTEIESGEIINITAFNIDLSGPISISCLFYPNGTKISSCVGITIEQLENISYGYGYGFLQGNLKYNITLNTNNYPPGLYSTKLIMLTNEGAVSSDGPDLTISAEVAVLEKCSVRAKEGEMTLLENYFGENNKLNFNVPKATAARGSGSLTAQNERTRFSYKFNVVEILSNNEDNATILVDGKYKIQRGPKISETATIYVNKNNKEVNIMGSDFNVEYMNVNFIKGCAP